MPRYWRSVTVPAAVVRRLRSAAGLTQRELALELELTVRTIERWESSGAVVERVSSLSSSFHSTRFGRLATIARRGALELEVEVDVAKLRKRQTRHFRKDPPRRRVGR
jgi:transcriptional regulator with XRE-family HTH domain